jgi:sulfatase maturation enzyme AslB (radical SAM superfamily)
MYDETQASQYNIKNMTIREWFNSEPMRQARSMMFDNNRNRICQRCYYEETVSTTSRRHRANQKSVIFTRSNFSDSIKQSPHWERFQSSIDNGGADTGLPVDLHIDLGNFCNLTCKMCNPRASSRIATQYVKWGIESAKQYVGTDWTRDADIWQRVLEEIASIPGLKNIHFMGGETLLTPRFEQFVDYMLAAGRIDLNFSFVTNGTVFNSRLLEKLLQFNRVGIEVSIETVTPHNGYVRQGTDTDLVLTHLEQYRTICNGTNITLTIRPAVSLLTIGYYHTLLEYCLQHGHVVKSLIVTRPDYLACNLLPKSVKSLYRGQYRDMLERLADVDISGDYNESDEHQLDRIIKNQLVQIISLLDEPAPENADDLLRELVDQCRRWDQVHQYNARDLYPELAAVWNQYAY